MERTARWQLEAETHLIGGRLRRRTSALAASQPVAELPKSGQRKVSRVGALACKLILVVSDRAMTSALLGREDSVSAA